MKEFYLDLIPDLTIDDLQDLVSFMTHYMAHDEISKKTIIPFENLKILVDAIISELIAIRQQTSAIRFLSALHMLTHNHLRKIILQQTHIPKNPFQNIVKEIDNVSLGMIISFLDPNKGPSPIIVYPEDLWQLESVVKNTAKITFSNTQSSNGEDLKLEEWSLLVGEDQCTICSSKFMLNPKNSTSEKEKITIGLIIRPHWNETENIEELSPFLVKQFSLLCELIQQSAEVEIVYEAIRSIRNFLVRGMFLIDPKPKQSDFFG
jgi:hypothetical protein